MKKSINLIASLVMAITLMLNMTLTSFAADSSISYEGGAEKYVFLPGSEYTDSDLFDNFKGVMPGDTLQQKITVQNDSDNSDYVKIYMRAESHDDSGNPLSENVAAETDMVSMKDFLSQLSMTVRNGDEVIFEASPDELDGLADNVLLGEFEPGENTELTVELSVPIELGNEYANRVGEVDWVFVSEELDYPDDPSPEPPKPDEPKPEETKPEEPAPEEPETIVKTGDNANMMIWISLLGLSALAIITTVLLKRKIK